MYALTQSEPALFTNDPEALLYWGFATLGILGKVETAPGAAAMQNFETGLAETAGNESRS